MKWLTHLYRPNSRNCDLRVIRTSLSFPFVGFLRKNPRLQWKRKEVASLGSRLRVWLYRVVKPSKNRERKRGRREAWGRKGVRICMPSRSLTAVHTDNSHVLFLRFSTGGIGIQRGKWKRISPPRSLPRVAPRQWRGDTTNFSSTFTRFLFRFKFQPFLRALFPLLPPACCVSPPCVISTLLRDFRSSLRSLNSSIERVCSCRKASFYRKSNSRMSRTVTTFLSRTKGLLKYLITFIYKLLLFIKGNFIPSAKMTACHFPVSSQNENSFSTSGLIRTARKFIND